jgi:hypothetical protein
VADVLARLTPGRYWAVGERFGRAKGL